MSEQDILKLRIAIPSAFATFSSVLLIQLVTSSSQDRLSEFALYCLVIALPMACVWVSIAYDDYIHGNETQDSVSILFQIGTVILIVIAVSALLLKISWVLIVVFVISILISGVAFVSIKRT